MATDAIYLSTIIRFGVGQLCYTDRSFPWQKSDSMPQLKQKIFVMSYTEDEPISPSVVLLTHRQGCSNYQVDFACQ